MYKFYFFIFAIFISNFIIAMEKNFKDLDKFKIEAYKKLTSEQQNALASANYLNDKDKGHQAIHILADYAVQLAYEEQLIDSENTSNSYANYLINLRESVLSSNPIKVTDEKSAQARAAQLLNNEQKKSLQKEGYLSNRDTALETIAIFAEYTFKLLKEHNLISDDANWEEFKQNFIKKKTQELDELYS